MSINTNNCIEGIINIIPIPLISGEKKTKSMAEKKTKASVPAQAKDRMVCSELFYQCHERTSGFVIDGQEAFI